MDLTNKETVLIFALIITEYEKFDISEEKVKLWATMLQDIPYRVVNLAVMTLLAKNPFPPKLSDIMKALDEITSTETQKMTVIEAWGEVTNAIRQYGQMREIEALASMSHLTARVVKNMGFKDICNTPLDELGVPRGQFAKMYESQKNREREDRLIPAILRKDIEKLSQAMNIKSIGRSEGD